MGDNVLYFPYIKVPKSPWFTQVLLYWDEIGSIVPSQYQRQHFRMGRYMQELVEAGLVKEVVPVEYDSTIPGFRSAFLKLIDENSFIERQRGVALKQHHTFRIHVEKMIGDGLPQDLVDRGLARRVEDPWWEMEITTANLFMGYLASVLGKLDNLSMDPITDQTSALSVFSKTPQRLLSRRSLVEQLRMSVLTDILPSPEYTLPVKELLNFKQSSSNLLPSFRRYIEAFLLDLSVITDVEQKEERIKIFKEQTSEQIDEIVARMNEKRWPKIMCGGVCSIVAAAIPGVGAITTGEPSLAMLALPGLVSAIYSAFQGMPNQQRNILREPLAYAAFARKRFPAHGRHTQL